MESLLDGRFQQMKTPFFTENKTKQNKHMCFIVVFLKYQYLTLHQKQKYLFSDKVLCRFHVLARIKHLVAVFETLHSRN